MEQLISITIFLGLGFAMVLGGLLVGKLVRPSLPNADKQATYECGEPTIGSSWVQFDLRFYIVALFYLVFDVEVALIYAWAVVYREFPAAALALGLPFLGVVIVGYVYEWHCGSLDWVRSSATTSVKGPPGGAGAPAEARPDWAALARRDPEAVGEEQVGKPA